MDTSFATSSRSRRGQYPFRLNMHRDIARLLVLLAVVRVLTVVACPAPAPPPRSTLRVADHHLRHHLTDGSYACTSLCPQEMIRPSQRCKAPRLAEVRGQCCRQWTCAGDAPTSPAPCEPLTSDWSPCSATCGAGVSTRITNQNRDCTLRKESRLCQIRECPRHGDISWKEALFKMIREDQKVCHPTQRSPEAVHLQWQNCTSVHRHRPNFCTTCQHQCCRPVATFTRSLAFLCDLDRLPSGGDHLWRLGDGSRRPPEAGTHMATVTQKVMWIKECSCGPCESLPQEEGAVEGGGVRSENGGEEDAWSKSWEGAKAQEFMGGDIDGEEAL
ncbi:CCN family member 1-like isoform X2 [Amphibalanus amphitrite]|uniref:CCN family member 1-like isoform X2 n=1 Tax=Amphibalanus amphitrite TaxID=1232801 RepID=UPI001C902890|nr:CCN family member 1-like isoform X2 [Amphibalanus amphitrite]